MIFSMLKVKFRSRLTGNEVEGEVFFAEYPDAELSECEILEKIKQLEPIIHLIWNERFRLAEGKGFSDFACNILHYNYANKQGFVELPEPDMEVYFVLELPIIAFVDLKPLEV